jgi:hypothetical protein
MPATVQWYVGLVRKNQRLENKKNPSINAVT